VFLEIALSSREFNARRGATEILIRHDFMTTGYNLRGAAFFLAATDRIAMAPV